MIGLSARKSRRNSRCRFCATAVGRTHGQLTSLNVVALENSQYKTWLALLGVWLVRDFAGEFFGVVAETVERGLGVLAYGADRGD